MAREKIASEINIVKIIKSQRYFEAALRYLLPEKKRLMLREHSRYIQINPDELLRSETKLKNIELKRQASMSRRLYTDGFFTSGSSLGSKVSIS